MIYIKNSFIKLVSFDENSITLEADREHYTFGKSNTVIFLVDPFAGQLDSIARAEKFTFDDFMDMIDGCDTKEDTIECMNGNFSSMGIVAIGVE